MIHAAIYGPFIRSNLVALSREGGELMIPGSIHRKYGLKNGYSYISFGMHDALET